MLDRMKLGIDKILRMEQSGFRSGRLCDDAIFTLRRIIESVVEFSCTLAINFNDFQKAFDSVDREAMWNILAKQEIPGRYINVIKSLYVNSNSKSGME